jgi:hypothetical protein
MLDGILNGTSLLQKFWQLLLLRLQVRIATNMYLIDEDVWNSALVTDLLQGVLNGRSVLDLIKLDGVEVGTQLSQQLLGRPTVWAVRLAKDGDSIVVDDALSFGLRGGHGCWALDAMEELA